MNDENDQHGSLLSGQDPHQKEEMDQATRASAASFNLEPEKGISPDPDEYNKGDEQGNIKQIHADEKNPPADEKEDTANQPEHKEGDASSPGPGQGIDPDQSSPDSEV